MIRWGFHSIDSYFSEIVFTSTTVSSTYIGLYLITLTWSGNGASLLGKYDVSEQDTQ